jgi:acetyl-CoA synthetase
MTYRELQHLVNRVSNGLIEQGFKVGDPIAVDMPMTIESVAIYLGIVQAGMVAVSIADSFSPPEIEKRLRISSSKGIFTVEGYMRSGKKINIYNKVLEAKPPRVIVLPVRHDEPVTGLRAGDVEWTKFLSSNAEFHPFYAAPDHHTNILFSSGTTGDPKAIPWTQLTPLKAAADGYYHQDIHPGDVVCWPTNVGWMMGPWLIYQLINKATIALFYGAPSGTPFGKFVEDAGVTMLGTIPTMVKNWMQTRCMESCDWSSLKVFSSTGECSHPSEVMYLLSLASFQAPMIEYCGGTEIGGGYITGTVVQDQALSAFSTPALGLDLVILGPDNKSVPVGQHGEVWLNPPSIGLSEVLLNRDHFKEYYQDTPKDPRSGGLLRRHGDQMGTLAKGYYQALGRTDDTMNLGGIKVSSAELERCMAVHPRVSEVAAIGIQSTVGQTDLVAFVVTKSNAADSTAPAPTAKQLKADLQHVLRRDMNPLFKLYDVVLVDLLPKTASNKVMRRVLRDQYVQKKKKKKAEKKPKSKL